VSSAGWLSIAAYLAVLAILAWPLGRYLARVYDGEPILLRRVLGPVERLIYRAAGVRPDRGMGWAAYATAFLAFNAAGALALYVLLRVQGMLPGEPSGIGGLSPDRSFNTAASFVTNTDWQAYSGETSLRYLTQMLGLTTQNFASAAGGMAVLMALVRGLRQRSGDDLGNFWVDLTRGFLYVLLPLSLVLAVFLVSQGVVQTLAGYPTVRLLEDPARDQVIAVGPAASQIAVAQLGTNGGGFFGVNAAHPLANPTPLTNLVEALAILLIPAALCHTFGAMVKDPRQGLAILAAMSAIFVPLLVGCALAEHAYSPALARLGVDQAAGNLEGKELRFGAAGSALWAAATTAASNGSVDAMHDAFTPLGGLAPLWLMQLGEVAFGGVGSGLYGMLVFAVVAVFVAGLMVGRTPELLGKKVEAFEMKMASLVILVPAAAILIGSAVAVLVPAGRDAAGNPGPHGFTEILYAFSSAANNNGSAFAGLDADRVYYNVSLGLVMLVGRFWVALPVLAMAGSFARKKVVPASAGTLPTHTPLFVAMLVFVVALVGALTFLPALALGPIVEHLELHRGGAVR
jgi:K+-transporting ATPase ATPase A chain